MLLESMLKGLEHTILNGRTDIEILGFEQDSRKVVPGGLFIAVKGFKSDGHDYIEKAIELGATAIVITDPTENLLRIASEKTITIVQVTDDRYAMSHLAAAFNRHADEKLTMVGITGTNGKTSTCRIIADMLNHVQIKAGILGTIANEIAGKTYKASLTTPEPIELHGLLKQMYNDNVPVCVMEASSHALDLKRLEHVHFDYGIFTNLSEDHLDYHADFEAYFEAKSKLFDMTSKGRLINIDDDYGERLVNKYKDADSKGATYSYGIDKAADIYAEDITYKSDGSTYTLVTPNGRIRLSVPLPGKIYVYNTLAAFGTLFMMGMSNETIALASTAIGLVPGRMEIVKRDSEIRVFVDYAHTPDALSNAIDIARSMTDQKVITVFGCGGDRDKKKRPLMGGIAEEKSDKIIVTSDNPRTEDPQVIIEEILVGLKLPDEAMVEPDRKLAIEAAIKSAQKGDIILIAGKGHETYQEINGIRHDFDDKRIALEFLITEAL